MSAPRVIAHDHQPVFRVVRASWPDALDASFSQKAADNRWNDREFAVLYLCCSPVVARVVALDILGYGGIDVRDLHAEYLPQLVHITWRGQVIDMVSMDGIAGVGLPLDYPSNIDKSSTRALARQWFHDQCEGVVCRSASMMRRGLAVWNGAHEAWGELALFVGNLKRKPKQAERTTLVL